MGDGHLLMAKLLYGCGLRLMECIRLRVKDLDFEGRMIYIRAGKGDKDRVTVLPNNLMEDLRTQVEVVRTLHDQDVSEGFCKDLRTGIVRRHHVLESGLQKAVKTAAERGRITKRVGCHTFRHCFATHMPGNGVNIRVVQKLMEHAT